MRFYKVEYLGENVQSLGCSWHTSRREAERAAKESIGAGDHDEPITEKPEIEVVEIKPTKAGILAALNTHAVHPDNG